MNRSDNDAPHADAQVLNVLVVDVGGSHIKCVATGQKKAVSFKSGPNLTPGRMMKTLREITADWEYDAVSIGYPGVVLGERIPATRRRNIRATGEAPNECISIQPKAGRSVYQYTALPVG
ncbi:MAG: hypothetical protein JO067_06970 [Cupriavidus sp.]|nr:hypothetical protein [Cupriavidus sp.]